MKKPRTMNIAGRKKVRVTALNYVVQRLGKPSSGSNAYRLWR
jgi:hypothetical protein